MTNGYPEKTGLVRYDLRSFVDICHDASIGECPQPNHMLVDEAAQVIYLAVNGDMLRAPLPSGKPEARGKPGPV